MQVGIYDTQITSLRRKIDNRYNQIRSLKKNIRELEELLGKCDKIDSKTSETMNTIFRNIDQKGSLIKGNFVSYYKSQIDQIAKNNRLYDISGATLSDKNQIKNKIISCEDQIQRLYGEINSLESDLAYYQANNIEPEVQVN